jgi:hypothetical protein
MPARSFQTARSSAAVPVLREFLRNWVGGRSRHQRAGRSDARLLLRGLGDRRLPADQAEAPRRSAGKRRTPTPSRRAVADQGVLGVQASLATRTGQAIPGSIRACHLRRQPSLPGLELCSSSWRRGHSRDPYAAITCQRASACLIGVGFQPLPGNHRRAAERVPLRGRSARSVGPAFGRVTGQAAWPVVGGAR